MNLLINPDVDLNSVLDIENDPDIADRDFCTRFRCGQCRWPTSLSAGLAS